MTFGYDPEKLQDEKEIKELDILKGVLDHLAVCYQLLGCMTIDEDTTLLQQAVAKLHSETGFRRKSIERERVKRLKRLRLENPSVDVEVDEHEEMLLAFE